MKKISRSLKLLFMSVILTLSFSNVMAIDFEFKDIEGDSHKLSEYKGKWVLINFWATWCPPCRKEIPELSDFHLEHDDAVVIGVNYEPGIKDEKLKKFIAVYLVSYPVTRVNEQIIEAVGEPRGLPTSFLINPEGEIAKKITGMVTLRSLDKVIVELSNISGLSK